MGIMEMQANALMQLCAAKNETDREIARQQILQLMQYDCRGKLFQDPEYLVRQILLDLGAPDHLLGHPYVVEAILLTLEDGMYIHNITFGLYPQLAATFDTTAARVERAIRHLVEVVWARGDLDTLQRYFGNTVGPERGKPTNSEFIARLVNVARQHLRQAA